MKKVENYWPKISGSYMFLAFGNKLTKGGRTDSQSIFYSSFNKIGYVYSFGQVDSTDEVFVRKRLFLESSKISHQNFAFVLHCYTRFGLESTSKEQSSFISGKNIFRSVFTQNL